eukprot:6187828-Pleurochrysis_carterae.AAC.5
MYVALARRAHRVRPDRLPGDWPQPARTGWFAAPVPEAHQQNPEPRNRQRRRWEWSGLVRSQRSGTLRWSEEAARGTVIPREGADAAGCGDRRLCALRCCHARSDPTRGTRLDRAWHAPSDTAAPIRSMLRSCTPDVSLIEWTQLMSKYPTV